MKAVLILLLLAAGCKAPKTPEPEANRVEKYVGELQTDVKRAQAAKEKADAANAKAKEAEKLPE
jgi:hypothetical protein